LDILLSPIEVRILGALIEKELATPQYYPLSLNSLVNACNQKSNRDPVMSLDEAAVSGALDQLIKKKLAWRVSTTGNRVLKIEHDIKSIRQFTLKEVSLLCELFVRGPQTLGELRTHTARFCKFLSLDEVNDVIQGLIGGDDGAYVQELERELGRREKRYAHLFSGEVVVDTESREKVDTYTINTIDEAKRVDALEVEVARLNDELDRMKEEFNEFKKQFE